MKKRNQLQHPQIMGGNLLRAMKEMENVAIRMKQKWKPFEEVIFPNATCRSKH